MSNFHGGYQPPRLFGEKKSKIDDIKYSEYSLISSKSQNNEEKMMSEYHRFGESRYDVHINEVEDVGDTIELLGRLNRSIADLGYVGDDLSEIWENKSIPAGYVYLLQLSTHDLVHTSVPIARIKTGGDVVRNLRRTGLELETIFGGGPEICPHIYTDKKPLNELNALGDESITDRPFLKLMASRPGGGIEAKIDSDIARSGAILFGDSYVYKDVLISDSRNDDNSIISQMTALFHRMYNEICSRLRLSNEVDVTDIALYSRSILSISYRNIIRCDLLNKLLNPTVWQNYERIFESGKREEFLDQPIEGESRPVEFAYAAARLPHFMTRPSYKLQRGKGCEELIRIIRTSSRRDWREVPPDATWIIDWPLFFPKDSELVAGDYNRSALIRPRLNRHLNQAKEFSIEQHSDFAGLFLHDLIRGVDAGLRNAPDFCADLRDMVSNSSLKEVDLQNLHSLLPSSDDVKHLTKKWLQNLRLNSSEQGINTQKHVDYFVENTPLMLYLLIESEEYSSGKHLGPVASVIYGEVFYRSICRPGHLGDWDKEVSEYANIVFKAEEIPKSMPELIETLLADA